MKIRIIETRDLDTTTDINKSRLIRLVDIDGVRHLQIQLAEHEIMRATWGDGVLMTCPRDLTLDMVAADIGRYVMGYGDGCEMLDKVPEELWQ